jgi:hypothetical protein
MDQLKKTKCGESGKIMNKKTQLKERILLGLLNIKEFHGLVM